MPQIFEMGVTFQDYALFYIKAIQLAQNHQKLPELQLIIYGW